VREGAATATHWVALNLACDNRILQGPEATTFLARVRQLVEAAQA
jgi:hypothetical protein